IERRYLASLAEMAFSRIAFHLPRSHAQKIAAIAGDASASPTERFLAASLLQNAAIAAEGIFPLCQDTGSALVYGWKGERCESRDSAAFAGSPSCAGGASPIGDDALSLAQGIDHAYAKRRLRASQLRPLDVIAEQNTRDNLPAGIDIRAVSGNVYHLLFCAKGGGSTGKTTLTMESPSLLLPDRLKALLSRRISDLGTSGCPPYTISAVIGGVTPSQALYALELANFGLLDHLPESPAPLASPGSKSSIALRSREWEGIMMRLATDSGIGLQWGGSHMALDTRFVRLSRHAANLPVAIGVSCVAHRKALALINEHGWFLERLEDDPAKLLPAEMPVLPDAVPVNFDLPMREWLGRLRSMPAGTKLLLSGIVTLARDAAHARLQARLERGEPLPSSVVEHPIFYAGPTEPADGQVTGSIGPTTAKRMDSYMEPFMRQGAGLVTIGKGERSQSAASVIAQFGGIYLAAIGGTAAMNARNHVKESRIEDYADLGMEAIRSVRLTDLPAIVAIDASGSSIYCKSKHEASPKT
ncbi:MAG: fumarate hydratase C-terminal domain-containing protein, partial [Spirochaetaceae bacterium]|nr:fumarate hydratase C-terminal domain-containing protein [Spirochaetaceae bacterium]